MSRFTALPALLVGEFRVVNVLLSSLFFGFLIFSLFLDLLFHFLDELQLLFLMVFLHLSHFLLNLVSLLFVELRDLLLEDMGTDCWEFLSATLNQLNWLNRCFLERVWFLNQGLLESFLDLLKLVVDFRDFDALFTTTMVLVIVHCLIRRVLAELKHVVQLLDYRVSAIIGWQDWLKVDIFVVWDNVRTALHCLLHNSLDFWDFLVLHFFREEFGLLVGKEICFRKKPLDDIDCNVFLSYHWLIFNDLDNKIFLELIDQWVKAKAISIRIVLNLLRCLGLCLLLLVIVRLLTIICLDLEFGEVGE